MLENIIITSTIIDKIIMLFKFESLIKLKDVFIMDKYIKWCILSISCCLKERIYSLVSNGKDIFKSCIF